MIELNERMHALIDRRERGRERQTDRKRERQRQRDRETKTETETDKVKSSQTFFFRLLACSSQLTAIVTGVRHCKYDRLETKKITFANPSGKKQRNQRARARASEQM